MKIVFISFIDSENYGDQLIVSQLENELLNGHKLSKFTFNFVEDTKLKKVESNLLNTNNRNKLKDQLIRIYNDYFRKQLFFDFLHNRRVQNKINKNLIENNFENTVKQSDFIVVGGGNAIFDLTKKSSSYYKFEKITEIAEKYNKKIFVTSVGIGPFQTNFQKNKVREVLSKVHAITVRDTKSYSYIEGLKNQPILSVDPVLILPKIISNKEIRKDDQQNVIGISVINLLLNKSSTQEYKSYINDFKFLVEKLQEKKYKIILFSTEPKDYSAVNELFMSLNSKERVYVKEIHSAKKLVQFYNEIDFLIGTRMHSLIIAFSQGIPFVGISWQDKVSEFFKVVNRSLDVFSLKELHENSDAILEKISVKINSFEKEELTLKKDKEIIGEKFKINNVIMNKIIEELSGVDHEYKNKKITE